MAVDKYGNFTKCTPEVIQKLEDAFSMDCGVVEACLLANISAQTYYNWIEKNSDMKERFETLRKRPILKARQTVMAKLGDNYQNAMDYLKRKQAKEFGDRIQNDIDGNLTIKVVDYKETESKN